MCWVLWELLSRDPPVQSESDLCKSLPGRPECNKVHNTSSHSHSASCLSICPLKATRSRLHDQAAGIGSPQPLPCHHVYGLLCQQVTSSICGQFAAVQQQIRGGRSPSNEPEMCTDGDGFGALLPHAPFKLGPLKMLRASRGKEEQNILFFFHQQHVYQFHSSHPLKQVVSSESQMRLLTELF